MGSSGINAGLLQSAVSTHGLSSGTSILAGNSWRGPRHGGFGQLPQCDNNGWQQGHSVSPRFRLTVVSLGGDDAASDKLLVESVPHATYSGAAVRSFFVD